MTDLSPLHLDAPPPATSDPASGPMPTSVCTPPPPAVRLERISKTFGAVRALDDVSLHIPGGTTVAVIGANGAGKSTLLATIAGLTPPSSGTVTVAGTTAADAEERSALLGALTHTTMLYDHLTGRENLELHARLRGLSRTRVEDVIDQMGLAEMADRPTAGRSHGTRKRLALARALLHDPPVLLLDEPFAGLDPASSQRLMRTLETLRGSRTILFSTHDLARATAAADRIVEIDAGRITAMRSTAPSHPPPAPVGGPHRAGHQERTQPAGMLRTAWEIVRKDLVVEARSRAMATSVLMLAVLLATVLGMAFEPLAGSPHAVSGVLWVLVAFTGLHGLVRSFDEDARDDALRGLLLAGADPAGIYLGRVVSTTLVLLGLAGAATLTVAVLFAAPALLHVLPRLLIVVTLAVVGLAAVGTILTVLARHSRLGETLLPLLFLPLAVPVLLAGIESVVILLEVGELDGGWVRVLVAYAVGMLAAGTVVFDHAVEG